jgi:hypothetical protein
VKERKPKGYWTFERCKEEALKYNKKINFRINNCGCYTYAYRRGWLDDICLHMIKNTYWNYEKCKEEALKFKTRAEFSKKSGGAYNMTFKMKWLDEVCSHMTIEHLPKGYWTYDKCKVEALKYKTKKEFEEYNASALTIARRNGWLKEICEHMVSVGNKYKRCIYSYEFSDNYVYVGLTYNLTERHNNRFSKKIDIVYKHYNKTGINPILKQLTEYITVKEARVLEGVFVEKYKSDGWNILNIYDTGGIGGNILHWSKEKCIEAILKCSSRTEFKNKYRGAQNSAFKNKWYKEIIELIPKNKNIKYTKTICLEKAILCNTRQEFKKRFIHEFSVSYTNKWLDDICIHMVSGRLKWTYDKCKEVSLLCKNKHELELKYKGAYCSALRNNWINEFFK